MAKIGSAGGAAGYFAQDNYYTRDQAEVLSEWGGSGSQALGLDGRVDAATFEDVLNGKLPGGTRLGDPALRAKGTDFTFSAPKSVSLLALVTGDKRIEAAQHEAVKVAMTWAEKNLAETRIRIDGKIEPVRTGNLVYALFPHDTSRALDPQLHTHAVSANLTRLPEHLRGVGRTGDNGEVVKDHGWRAVHNKLLWDNNATLRSIYHSQLRGGIETLGYETRLTGKHGTFEVAGVTREAIAGMSKRASQINERAEELGMTSDRARDRITVRTRDDKVHVEDREALQAQWRDEAKGYGYDGDKLYAEALARSAPERSPLLRGARAILEVASDARDSLKDYLRRPSDPLVDKGLTRLLLTPGEVRTQYALASAIRIESEREAAFTTRDLTKSALDLGLTGVSAATIERRIGQLVERGELVREQSTRFDGAVDRITTREAIQTELAILAELDKGRGAARPLLPAGKAPEVLQALSTKGELGADQLAAAMAIVSSNDRIVLVQGRAGSGKSTMLQPVARAEALDAAGHVLGELGREVTLLTADQRGEAQALAFQNKMVADLKRDTGMSASTLHAFLARHDKILDGTASPQAMSQARARLQGRYLLLDEASMVSAPQMHQLVRLANLMEVGRLAVIGDHKQLSSIEWGKAFANMQAAKLEAGQPFPHVDQNRRQQTETMRALADAADAGNLRGAFAALGDRTYESADPVEAAARAWLALKPEQRENTVLFPSGREGRATANRIIQDELKAEGTLTGPGLELTVRERVNIGRESLRYGNNWREAQWLEVTSRNNALGLPRGDYRIGQVFANGKVRLHDARGRSATVDPLRIAPGKANTALRLTSDKRVLLHQGERLRWTDNDKQRGLLNAETAKVSGLDDKGVIMRLQDGSERLLLHGDPMLKRLDLAYAINTHMGQGITTQTVFAVMQSWERNLSNRRSFLVNFTRQREDARLFTDDAKKLEAQIASNLGNKSSALEATGKLDVDNILSRSRNPDLTQASDHTDSAARNDARAVKPKDHAPAERTQRKEPALEQPVLTLDRSRGLEL